VGETDYPWCETHRPVEGDVYDSWQSEEGFHHDRVDDLPADDWYVQLVLSMKIAGEVRWLTKCIGTNAINYYAPVSNMPSGFTTQYISPLLIIHPTIHH
jgi:hypothetical protein